jgi:hypothetical protein
MVKSDKDLKEYGILLQKRREFTKIFQFTRNPNFGVPQITAKSHHTSDKKLGCLNFDYMHVR